LNDPGESIFESKLESTMRTVQVKVKGLQLVNGIWRSRKVLPPEVAAIVGKSELTRTTGVAGEKDNMVALAKARDVAVREDHQGEFSGLSRRPARRLTLPITGYSKSIRTPAISIWRR
jgi:hypothetical protein